MSHAILTLVIDILAIYMLVIDTLGIYTLAIDTLVIDYILTIDTLLLHQLAYDFRLQRHVLDHQWLHHIHIFLDWMVLSTTIHHMLEFMYTN